MVKLKAVLKELIALYSTTSVCKKNICTELLTSSNIVHENSVTNFKIVLKRLLGFNDLKLYFSSQRLFLFIFIQRGHMN